MATFAGCLAVSSNASAATTTSTSSAPTSCIALTDAEIFQAVFFGAGVAASRLPPAYVDARAKFIELEKRTPSATRIRALQRMRDKLELDGKAADAKLIDAAIRYYQRTDVAPPANGATQEAPNAAFLRAFEQRYPGELAAFGSKMRSGDPVAVRKAMRSVADKAMNVAMVFGQAPAASDEPYPEEDSNIAVVGLTFVVLFVIVFVAFPLTSGADKDGLREDEIAALMARGFQC